MRGPGEMEVLKVAEVRKEAQDISSILFKPLNIRPWKELVPGQFLMVWIPGVDEVPMSVSYHNGDPFTLGITVQDIGQATKALCAIREGGRIGIRGPYGNGFKLPSRDDIDMIIGVSGGVGGASTILPIEWAKGSGLKTLNLVGARTRDAIMFPRRWGSCSDRLLFSTDDGTLGHHGFVTELLQRSLDGMTERERDRSEVFTCGPEAMMVEVKKVLERYDVGGQFSLERYMKCGIGICDSCAVSGRRICMDGPVFSLKEISDLIEFGELHRDRSGRLIPINECVR